jgi:hypothetical protein
VGWGWVAVAEKEHPVVIGGAFGALLGDVQAAPRGELLAASTAMQHAGGHIVLVADASYVVMGRSKSRLPPESEKIKHPIKMVASSGPPHLVSKFWPMRVADGLASMAARKSQLPPNKCENVIWYDGMCTAVLLRSLCLLEWLHEHKDEAEALEATFRIP